jgi:hypothetical protein
MLPQYQFKMAAPLATCTNEEQRSVIRFLSSEGTKPIEIHRRMEVQYGEACLSLQQVYEWSRKFRNSVTSVADAPLSGQAHRVVTPESIAAAEAIVMDNRRVTVNETAANLNICHGSARHIIHDVLKFRKMSARWVPRHLTPELKERRVDACEEICGALKQKVVASLRESLQETKPGSTTTNSNPREQARNGAIPHHQNPRRSGRSHLQERLCSLSFGMNEALSWNTTRLGETPSPVRHIPIC